MSRTWFGLIKNSRIVVSARNRKTKQRWRLECANVGKFVKKKKHSSPVVDAVALARKFSVFTDLVRSRCLSAPKKNIIEQMHEKISHNSIDLKSIDWHRQWLQWANECAGKCIITAQLVNAPFDHMHWYAETFAKRFHFNGLQFSN